MQYLIKNFLWLLIGVSLTAAADIKSVEEKKPVAIPYIKAYEAKMMLPLAGVQLPQVFVRLQNTGDKPVSLIGATSAAAEKVVIMQAQPKHPDKARELTSLLLPAKTLVDLHRAGPYLLLKGLKISYQTGDQVHLQLRFSDNTQIDVVAIAKSAFDQPHHH